MSADKSLIQFILDLLRDPNALAEFKENPDAALRACGLTDVSPEDVHDAIVLAQDNDDTSFDRNYNTGGGHHTGPASVPPPPPVEADHGQPDHEAAIKYIDKYVTNNHVTNNIDDRDTTVDNSINQNIDTGGGDLTQDFDNHSVVSSGDGSVAAGGDIRDSNVTTGDDNIVGDGNKVVDGDDNTTAFGKGDAVHAGDISADNGGAVSIGGDAEGNQTTEDSYNDTHNESHTNTDIDDSYNTDSSTDVDTTTDSHDHTDVLSHNNLTVDVL